ncbi:MAG: stage III sporulation protein AE [Clostridia bacterium]|nr:stage III sporulation protein AE [Clostridia bacterium]
MKKLIAILLMLLIFTEVKATEIEQYSDGFNFNETVQDLKNGKYNFDISEIFNSISEKLLKGIKENYNYAITLLVVALFSSVAENIERSFDSKNCITFFVFFTVIIIYGTSIFKQCMDLASNALENLILFVNALYPVMLTTVASGGMVAVATTLHPVLMYCGEAVMLIIKTVIFPALSISMALKIANLFSQDIQAERLGVLIDGFIKWVVGIMMTLFVGIVAVTGISAPTIDSVSIRATKFAIGSFIPMVGNVISDSFDIIMNSSSVIKGSVGIAGLINILFICFTPCISLASASLALNLCSALVEPVCNKKIVQLIGNFGKGIFTMFGILCACACMFVLCTGVLVGIKAG